VDILERTLRIGKTLNIGVDLIGNLVDPITAANAVSSNNGVVTAGGVSFASNPVTVALTGVTSGTAVITINYSSASESDSQSFEVTVEEAFVEDAIINISSVKTISNYSVDTLWQNSDNIFPVEAIFLGVTFSPTLVSKAEYTIYNNSNEILVALELGSGITIDGEQFIVDIPRETMTFFGNYMHQFVIYDLEDNKLAPIFQRKITINRVPVPIVVV